MLYELHLSLVISRVVRLVPPEKNYCLEGGV